MAARLADAAVLENDEQRIAAWSVVPTGARNREAIARARDEVLRTAGVSTRDLVATVATGYGRNRVEGRIASVTEIYCSSNSTASKTSKPLENNLTSAM